MADADILNGNRVRYLVDNSWSTYQEEHYWIERNAILWGQVNCIQ